MLFHDLIPDAFNNAVLASNIHVVKLHTVIHDVRYCIGRIVVNSTCFGICVGIIQMQKRITLDKLQMVFENKSNQIIMQGKNCNT